MATLHETIESLAFCCKGLCEYCAFEDEHKKGNPCDIALMCEAETFLKAYESRLTQLEDMMNRYDTAVAQYEEAVRNCEEAENKYKALADDWSRTHFAYEERKTHYEHWQEKYYQAIAELEANEPLTWNELLTMKGKPVWMVMAEESKWIVILNVGKCADGKGMLTDEHDFYMEEDMGKKWIAYRKECDYVKRS